MPRLLTAWVAILLAAASGLARRLSAQSGAAPLLGTWVGEIRSGSDAKPFAARFERRGGDSVVVFWTLPEGNIRDAGPAPVSGGLAGAAGDREFGTQLLYFVFRFWLAPDAEHLTGQVAFDGHELPFALSRGPAPAASSAPISVGRVAEPRWTFGTGGPIWSSPALGDDAVYVGSNDGFVYGLVLRSGRLVWRFKTGGSVFGAPTLDGRALYVLSDDGFLYKLDRRTGTLLWRFDTHGGSLVRQIQASGPAPYDRLASAATVAGALVYIGSADGRLYAVERASGRERWHFATQGVVRSTPAVAAGRVFIGSYDHHVYAVGAESGTLDWQYDTLEPVVSSPLVVAGSVYVGSRSSDLFALDASTGAVRWRYFYWSSWVESSARLHDGVLYVGSSDYEALLAIDAARGTTVWKCSVGGEGWPSPAVTADLVYMGAVGFARTDRRGGFYAVERSSGQVAWRYPMSAPEGSTVYGVGSSPVVGQGLVLVGGLDGTLYAFSAGG